MCQLIDVKFFEYPTLQQVENGVEDQPDRLEIFKLTHRKKGKTNEYVDPASTKAVVSIEITKLIFVLVFIL